MFFKIKSPKKNLWLWLVLVFFVGFGLIFGALYYRNTISWRKAEDYYKTGQYQKVVEQIGNLSMPQDARRLEIYGRSMMAVRELDKAYQAYEKLNKIANSLDSKLIMANIKSEKGDFEQAEKLYLEIIDKNPQYVQTYLNLASLYRIKGDQVKANEILLKGVKNNLDSPSLYEYLLSINEDKSKTAEYKDWLEKLKKLDPNNRRFQ